MQRFTKFSHLYQGLLPILLGVLAVGGLLLGAQPVFAGTITGSDVCLTPLSGLSNPGCTAGDISLSAITNQADVSPSQCTEGETFTLTATFTIVTTATTRYDIGIYFDIGGDTEGDGAKTGTCSLSTLPTSPPPYLDKDGDFCGDTVKGTVRATVTIPGVLCADPDGDGLLNLPYCTSWDNNSNTACTTERGAKPGTTSKCNCQPAFQVPVHVTAGEITATKSADPSLFNESELGTSVNFTVTVTNIGDAAVTLSTIVDDPDKNPATINSTTYTTILTGGICPAGQQCASCNTLTVAPSGGTAACTFARTVTGGPGPQTDRACANGTDTNGNPLQGCGEVTVTIGNVNPSATVTKTPQGTVCATVRYNVTVQNTDPAESITLDKLCDDKFGTIIGTGCAVGTEGPIIGTTCAVPQTLTVSGTTSSYSCTFDAEVCTAGHQDTVTATVSDNDGHSTTAVGSATVNAPPAFLPPTP